MVSLWFLIMHFMSNLLTLQLWVMRKGLLDSVNWCVAWNQWSHFDLQQLVIWLGHLDGHIKFIYLNEGQECNFLVNSSNFLLLLLISCMAIISARRLPKLDLWFTYLRFACYHVDALIKMYSVYIQMHLATLK